VLLDWPVRFLTHYSPIEVHTVHNRIASFFCQSRQTEKTVPAVRVVNQTTINDPCNGLPPVYHTCGVRCFWMTRPGSINVVPVCPKCERFEPQAA
jgi:hypothetical protein